MSAATEYETMGKVTVEIELTNANDEINERQGIKTGIAVRKASVIGLVDTGATMLVLPIDVIQKLGLTHVRKASSRVADGRVVQRGIFGPVKITVLQRDMIIEAAEGPIGVPPLLGQIPLGGLDFHVDPKGQRLIPNPESPDMAMIDL